MREIKFKGLRIDGHGWHYGDLNQNCIDINLRYCVGIKQGKNAPHEVLPESVCQYIGLTDINELEIFEGDITKDRYVIMWCEEKALFAEFFKNGYSKEWNIAKYPIDHRSIEIIGNIHENPELLCTSQLT